MATIPYPSWLPLAQRASKNLTFQTPFRKDTPAVGAPIFQKLTTDVAATWSLTWKFTLAEERAFIQWLRSPSYLNKCNNWFTMMIDLGGSGLQEQTLHFTDYPVQTSIDGGVVTWTGNVIAKKLNNTMDDFDDVLVELDYRWYSWLDEVVNREIPQVYMTPILHMPINMLSSTLDSRIVYDGPQVYYINRNGNLVQSATNEWPLTFINGVAVGRVPPEDESTNSILYSADFNNSSWSRTRITVENDVLSSPLMHSLADKLVATSVNGAHGLTQPILPIGSSEYSVSFFIKAGGLGKSLVQIGTFSSQTNTHPVTIDLISGVITSANDFTRCGILPISDDWYFVWTSSTTTSSPSNILAACLLTDQSGNTTFTGNDVDGIYLWGAKLEKSEFATSPIITNSSAVTRQAASAKVAMNGATSIDITYSDGSVVNVQAVDDYATIPQADSAWGSKYITTIKFNV